MNQPDPLEHNLNFASFFGLIFSGMLTACEPTVESSLLSVLRRLAIRTQGEIDREKYILKALRGDFAAILKSS